MLAEDSMDRYVIEEIESRVRNPYVRLLVRSGLNPTRSMANLMASRAPWHRDTRLGIRAAPGPVFHSERLPNPVPQTIPSFEFLATTRGDVYLGPRSRGRCIGGGGAAAFRISPQVQFVGDVSGCKLTGFGEGRSGDSLTYLVGPRWTKNGFNRWQPYAQVLDGGWTITHDEITSERQVRESQNTGLALSARVGLDVKLTEAIAIRVADAGYLLAFTSGRH